MYHLANRLAIFSMVTFASLGQLSAQERPVEIPAAAVRQIMIDESCPNRSARGYGERLESNKHKICLALALHAIGCMPDPKGQSNPDIYGGLTCFHELYGSPGMWPDERMVGILLGGHISGVKFPELVRSRPRSPLHLRMIAEQNEQQESNPSTIQDLQRLAQDILRPFDSGAEPLKGSTTFAESFGVELVSDSAGDWRIGRVAVGSAAWFAFDPLRSYTGQKFLEVHFKPVEGSGATFVSCDFDYCLKDVAAQLVVDDEVELYGVDPSLSFGRVTPPSAPWVNWSDRMDGEQDKFHGQLAFSRTGLLFGDSPDGSLVVIAINPESPSASSGLEVGDTIERRGTRDTGESFFLPRPAHRMHAFLAEEGHAVSIATRGDGAVKQMTIQRSPGGVRFHDGVAIFDATQSTQYASRADQRVLEQPIRIYFEGFPPDMGTVLRLIFDGQHEQAQNHRASAGPRGNAGRMIQDILQAPIIAVYEAQGWWQVAADYGYARAHLLGDCGDVVPTGIVSTRTVNGQAVGERQESTLYFLRGLRGVMQRRLDEQQSAKTMLGVDMLGGGWPAFFSRYTCGSPEVERMDREITAFAQRF